MDAIVTPYAPNPGDAKPGNLYADLGTRTLWLGVDLAVDAAGAVLIADIVNTQYAIDQTLLDANAYTDAQITTRAPTVHTHTASQITDFTAAVTAVASAIPALSYVRGMVMMYSGSLADIGVGSLAGWALCDGSNGTPDLRERFVLAAGSRAVGSKNTQTAFDTSPGGGHDHQINAMVLDNSQMPYHNHSGATAGRNADHQHFFNANTGGENVGHVHNTRMFSRLDNGSPVGGTWAVGGNNKDEGSYSTTDRNTGHFHNVQGWTGGENVDHAHGIYPDGGNQPHGHTMVGGGGAHAHNIQGTQLREALPFYALAFIMKL